MRSALPIAAALFLNIATAAAQGDCPVIGAGAYRELPPSPIPAQGPPEGIERVADHAVIPPDPNNRDWVCYQAWLAAGHTPLPQESR